MRRNNFFSHAIVIYMIQFIAGVAAGTVAIVVFIGATFEPIRW